MSGNQHEALRWLKQAEKDLNSARNSLGSGDYEWACFQSQQSAEKALKAVLYLRGYRKVLTHSIFELVSEIGRTDRAFMRLTRQAKVLDGVYFISPHAIPTVSQETWCQANIMNRRMRTNASVVPA